MKKKNIQSIIIKKLNNLDYAFSFWKTQHKLDINKKAVKSAITTKLLSEHTAQLKQDGKLAKASIDHPDQLIEFELIDQPKKIIDDLCNESEAAV